MGHPHDPRFPRGKPPWDRDEIVEHKWSVPLSDSFLMTAQLSRPFWGRAGSADAKRSGLLPPMVDDEADSMVFRGTQEATGGTVVRLWGIPARGLSFCR